MTLPQNYESMQSLEVLHSFPPPALSLSRLPQLHRSQFALCPSFPDRDKESVSGQKSAREDGEAVP